MRLLLALAVSMTAAPAQAGQPISESLVECSALFDTLNRASPWRRQTEKGAALEAAAVQLFDEARVVAAEEGRSGIDAYLSDLYGQKAASWDDKGTFHLLSGEGREWMKYCASLARSRGLKFG